VRALAPCLGRISGPLVGRPDGALPLQRGPRRAVGLVRLLLALLVFNVFPNLVTKLNCKYNREMCRNPKLVKPILLGS
jgi:hypothetical protein